MSKNRILALDACTEACSAALYDGAELISRYAISPREHSQRLLPMVDELLAEAELKIGDVDAIAFGRGPGSFTGVRICVGFAQGLALGADRPMIGISTLEAMALEASELHQHRQLIAAIDARMAEIYVAAYEVSDGKCQPSWPEQVIKPDVLVEQAEPLAGKWIGVGSGWGTYGDQLKGLASELEITDRVQFPSAASMAKLALPKLLAGEVQDCADVEPIYLRNEVTWKKLPGR
ncbi:tRNA (adenosine(37)-N6)-threonylcarbamoyltransferase complex dimerization subunit type 1 TsaB [Corallincola platygyrae]|uniref:tRNA threonylcarbamoyladenosine biosynthesis protein TsaB n=1 Tax=Corallincola platygyrae TaxID=1193278 RepID=A0ABW4XU81_9GAMM